MLSELYFNGGEMCFWVYFSSWIHFDKMRQMDGKSGKIMLSKFLHNCFFGFA